MGDEMVRCPACGVVGLVCLEMAHHVERCVAGIRMSSRGTLREMWERKRDREERKREERERGRARKDG